MKNIVLGILISMFISVIFFTLFQYSKRVNIIPSPVLTPTIKILSETPIISPPPTKIPTSDTDIISLLLYQKNNWQAGSAKIEFTTNDGNYASGTVKLENASGYFYAAYTDQQWHIVADGNGVIMCSILVKYPDFPSTLIPECYDSANGKMIKR